MTDEQKNNLKEWIAALRSGEYKQETGALYRGATKGYCCLGVACEVQKLEKRFQRRDDHFYGYVFKIDEGGDVAILDVNPDPDWFHKQFGFLFNREFSVKGEGEEIEFYDELINLNDEHGFTFDEIANLLEEEFLK